MIHKPVLEKEVLEYLDPKPNENFIDCTVGEGGHAKLILEKIGPFGKVLGIDLDPEQIRSFRNNIKNENLILVNDSYVNLKNIVQENRFAPVNGILLDLGFSSAQLEGRGLAFSKNEKLDMRYNKKTELTAEKIINEWPEREIEKILRELGEEKFSKQIAKKIVQARPLKTTFELVETVKNATPSVYWHGKIHYATRTFQALRIAVNGELENLERVLPQIVSVLDFGGRIAIISFHSLEDRIVKNFFKNDKNLKILTKKPVIATEEGISLNLRARSAKLRAALCIKP